MQYDSENNTWKTWIDLFKVKIPNASNEAIKAIESLNAQILEGRLPSNIDTWIDKQKFSDDSLKKFFKTVDLSGDIFAQYQAHLKRTTGFTHKFSEATKKVGMVAKSLFATLASVGINLLIGVAIDAINNMIHAEENLRQSAQDLGSELSSTSSSVEDYKKRIENLHKIINDSSSSIQEVAQARTDLMAVQDELIDKFGTEKNVIEDITNAINTQANALDNLSRKAYYKAVNAFNEKELGVKFKEFLQYGSTDDERITSNMEKMVNSMRFSGYSLEATGNEMLDNLISKSYGLNLYDNMYDDGQYFLITGSLNEIQDKLYEIQELTQGFELSTAFQNSFTELSNDVDEALTSYQNLYDQYILYEKILNNDSKNQYDDQYKLINDAKKAYNDAVVSGNDDTVKTASEKYAQTLQTAIDMAMQNGDSGVAEYFKSMYPELQEIVGQWRFNLNFEPNTDGLKDKLFDALDLIDGTDDGARSFSVEQLNSFNTKAATDEQIEAYGTLISIAEEYELSISQLISLLEQMGIVQSEAAKMASEGFFTELEENFKEKFIDETLFGGDEATNEYNSIAKWFKGLNVDDKILAYELTVDYDTAEWGLEQFKIKLEEVRAKKEALNKTPISGLSEWIGTEDNKDAVSDVKSRIDTLRSAFDKLTELQNLIKDKTSDGAFDFSVEQSELDALLFDLLQEFPQLAEVTDGSIDSIEELRLAIARLCGEQPQKIIDELKKLAETEGITQAAKDELLDFAQTLENISQFDLSEIFDIEMDTTKQVINDMQDGLYQLAELKAAINDEGGLRLDFDEAKEYLKVFPELLRGAKYCADGTVQLNEGVTNEFIASREAQIRADGQARIAELENAKEVYISKRDYAKAKLEAIKVGLEAEGLADTQAVINKIQNIDTEREAFIQSGIDEVIANQAAAQAIGDDTKTLSDYIKEAVGISRDNVDIGAQDAANAVNLNAQAMQGSISGVGKMANAANQAIAKIGTGELVRLPGIEGESGKSSKKTFKDLLIQQGINPATGKPIRDLGNIDGLEGGTEELEGLLGKTQEEAIAEAKAQLEKMKSDLEKNIQGYDEAIASIDKQIEMINASASAKLDDYVAGIINSESDKKDKESSEKTFDWIETLIQNLERELQKLGNIADSTYIGWAERNSALAAQLEKTKELIGVQQAAYTRYMQEAESVGLSPYWKNLAKNGIIDISVIADEDLAEKISSYQEWIDKANGAQDAIQDLQNQLADISRSKFDNIAQEYDNKLSAIEHEVNVLNSLIEQTENSGHIVSEQYYKELINQEKKNKSLLEQEYSSLQAALAEAMRTGNIQENSEEWHSMQQELNGVQEAIIESNTAIIEFQNNIRQLKWDAFDRLQDKISNITSEAEFLIGLMEDSELYDDQGQLTDTGMATMGLHGQNYNVHMAQADKYAKEMAGLDKEYADDLYNTGYLERRQELLELQQDSILAAQDEKNAIRDLVEEGINLELEALQKLIDEYNKAQENARDLYEYQKNIQEQVENISSLEKQLSAYQGDTSEENKQRIQQIKVQLEEAREDLEETEMEHALSETQKMLDELYD